jgi:DNA-binding beta-propeller fold protein YncE
VAISDDGSLYVSDHGNDRVQVFDANGKLQRVIGSTGAAPGAFSGPSGLAVDDAGHLYVADSGNHRVQLLARGGDALSAIGGGPNASLEQPVDVAVSARRLYVSDAGRHTVQVFRRTGPGFK